MHKLLLFTILSILFIIPLSDLVGQETGNPKFRSDCAVPQAKTELSINNVRASLLTGGDLWWDLQDAGYRVPKDLGVSAIFAGAIWMGGMDPTGNVKVAGQTYRSPNRNDYFTGPLDENGETNLNTCNAWDRFFRVKADEVNLHKTRFLQSTEEGIPYPARDFPDNILGWPAEGNPYFAEVNGFSLPNTGPLASFHDYDGDGIYDPSKGDYPVLRSAMIGGGETGEMIPSEQVFNIFNDQGVHTRTNGFPMGVQVNMTSFAFQTDDEINDMTFYHYKVINRSAQDLDDMFFSLWIDPDLGCYADDFIGVDTVRNMFYMYNEDEMDGISECHCAGIPTYCENIPMLGVRFFDTPDQVGLTSFAYYKNPSVGNPPPATTDPNTAIEYYHYMSGVWRDGTPITVGGDGFNPGSDQITKYAFPSPPNENNPNSWSMCTEELGFGDRRLVASTSFGKFEAGAQEEVLFGLVYVPSQQYPCPDLAYLQFASDRANIFLLDELFEGEFIPKGPDAPDMTTIESDKEIIILLNNEPESNNYLESYREKEPLFRDSIDKDEYNYLFEGYVVYQLADNTVQASELTDESKARVVYQGDLKNEVTNLYNWQKIPDPFELYNLFLPELMVNASNQGVRKSLRLTEDAFAPGEDKSLVNHKPYYYMAIAYAHNSYQNFDPQLILGQRKPYLPGTDNIKLITAIPGSSDDGGQPMVYGSSFPVTRIDGAGNPGVFLELEDGMYDQMLSEDFSGEIRYKKGFGPVIAKVVDPGNLKNARLQLAMYNEDESIRVDEETRWVLRNLDSGEEIVSNHHLGRFSEQIVDEYGISLEMFLADSLGINQNSSFINPNNGIVNTKFNLFEPEATPWLKSVGSSESFAAADTEGKQFFPLKYVKNNLGEIDYNLDPTQALTSTEEPGFVPLFITDFRVPATIGHFNLSPMLINSIAEQLRRASGPGKTNNVDIVLTSDKSKWTRSIVVQTSNPAYEPSGYPPSDNTNMFDYREHPSIGKNGRYATDDGTKSGNVLTNSSPNPEDPNYIDPQGLGWFPGYAVDVETGQRLNILFGENSSYNATYQDQYKNGEVIGDDMIWNPSDQALIEDFGSNIMSYFMGGQHYIYVTNSTYDGGAAMHPRLAPRRNALTKRIAFQQITWAGFTMMEEGQELLSYEDGLIPSEMVVQLRVNQKYASVPNGPINGMPHYIIDIDANVVLTDQAVASPLERITLSPNPFMSSKHASLTLHQLPQNCNIHMFDVKGRIVLHQKLDGIVGERLESYSLEVNKDKMVPGVYFLRIHAPNEGVQTLKVLYL